MSDPAPGLVPRPEAELARLRAECQRLEQENDRLRKALAGRTPREGTSVVIRRQRDLAQGSRAKSEPSLHLSHAFVRFDLERRITEINTMAAAWLGRPKQDLKGRTAAEIDHAPWGPGVLKSLLDYADLDEGRNETECSFVQGGQPRTLALVAQRGKDGYLVEIWDRSAVRQVERTFERFVGREVLDAILAHAEERDDPDAMLAANRGEISILFADLRNFTGICRDLAPDQIKGMLDAYLDDVTRAVQGAGGTVDKFLGDGLMALFGAPISVKVHPVRAMRAGVEILRLHRQRMLLWKDRGLPTPEVGVGIEAGEVVYGCLGAGSIVNFTAIGSPVNVAARLCGEAGGGELLVSRTFYERVKPAMLRDLESFGGIAMKHGGTRELRHIGPVDTVRGVLEA